MAVSLEILLVLLVLANLALLGSSRLQTCIRLVASQAALMGVLPLLAENQSFGARMTLVALAGIAVKALGLPWLLRRAVREAGVQREIEPLVGFTTSLVAGVLLLGLALHLAARLPLPMEGGSTFLVPTSLFTILTGLFLIVTRNKAVMQVIGYLAMENGIFAFGLAFAIEEPMLVETGVLLDVFAAVFVMGITIHQINREFDHIDTDRLSALRD